jgi:hypothetical protein
MEFCGCVQNKEGDLVNRLTDIWDEVVELVEVKDMNEFWDEWSDVVWGVGRLVGYFIGLKYVRIYGDERHYVKIKERMEGYGCVRSRRHLKNGICCSVCLE